MPLIVGWLLVALFIWFAENIGTFTKVWLYPLQKDVWHLVSPHKIIAWYLVIIISFVVVSLVEKRQLVVDKAAPENALAENATRQLRQQPQL